MVTKNRVYVKNKKTNNERFYNYSNLQNSMYYSV